jgi:LPXTG-motif cell wall-anchored protein
MRTLLISACLSTAAAAVVLAAPAAYADAPGDNGTVKVHRLSTPENDMRNEPHVCGFYLDAFQFDAQQQVDWKIVGKAPTDKQGMVAETGTITLDADGHGVTGALHLKDGHYKLVWNFAGEHGRAKHKVFWVDCAGLPDDGGDVPGTVPSTSASASTGTDETQPDSPASSSPSADESDAAAPSSAPSPNGGSEDLAETGSSAPVGAIAGAAALLLGAGAYLTLRRRNSRARQH